MTGEEARRRGRTVKAFGWLQAQDEKTRPGTCASSTYLLPSSFEGRRGPARAGAVGAVGSSGTLAEAGVGPPLTESMQIARLVGPVLLEAHLRGRVPLVRPRLHVQAHPGRGPLLPPTPPSPPSVPFPPFPIPPLREFPARNFFISADGCKREQRDSSSGAPRRVHVYHTYRV